jgi:hypothetical protein
MEKRHNFAIVGGLADGFRSRPFATEYEVHVTGQRFFRCIFSLSRRGRKAMMNFFGSGFGGSTFLLSGFLVILASVFLMLGFHQILSCCRR